MRTSFELKFVAETLEKAREEAVIRVSGFLGMPQDEVLDKVDMEFKVSYPKAETVQEIEAAMESNIFQVVAYGSVRQNLTKPFGQ